jgi:hypothetical protein
MFKHGIPRGLTYVILQRDQVPHTIGEWQTALRNELQRQELIEATLGPKKGGQGFQKNRSFGFVGEGQQERSTKWRRDPNAMDVDAAIMGTETKKPDKKLSEGEKKKRQAEGRCYTCGRQGHLSRGCPKKRTGEKAKSARKAEINDQQKEKEEGGSDAASDPPPYNSEGMMAQIRSMTTDERDEFLDQLMMTEEDF